MSSLGLSEVENGTYDIGINPAISTIAPPQETLDIPGLKSSSQGIYDQLNNLYSEQDKQQKSIQEARDILGETASEITDAQVYELITEVQYLADTWIEEFERNVFDGKTLEELLHLEL